MRVRDMFRHFCGVCWIALILTGSVWLLCAVLFVISVVAGVSAAATFFGVMLVVYGGMLFLVSYLEARSHWKRGDR